MSSEKGKPQNASDAAPDQRRSGGVLRDYLELLRNNKKWWLLPIILVLLGIGAFLVLGGTGAAPLIYPIF